VRNRIISPDLDFGGSTEGAMANVSEGAEPVSIFAALARWWRGRNEVDALAGEDLDKMARDVGLSASDLRTLLRRPDEEHLLLYRRMEALHIDPHDLAWLESALLRDMQKVCTMCESRRTCLRDLKRDPDDLHNQDWRDYCPNVATLDMLAALKACAASEKKSEPAA
jgi:hypothetical protein